MNEKKLDDAIDRTVRDMTHVAADDDAVARVMARLRESDARGARDAGGAEGYRWMLAPRVAWAGAAALLLIAIVAAYSLRSSRPDMSVTHVAVVTPPSGQSSLPSRAVREIPTPVMTAPSTVQATTARNIRGRVVTPSSVVNGAADANEGRGQLEMPPLESDMQIASITPAPLPDAPAIDVEPLITSSLQVDEIPMPSIDMPPVSPERQE